MPDKSESVLFKTILFTVLALVAFASNSVLCRFALGEKTIGAANFTTIRLLSGAIVLFLILQIRNRGKRSSSKGSWFSAAMLFLYAASFSFAFLTLDVGTGALILFGSVQVTIILLSLFFGNRLHLTEWIGVVVAFAGFAYLVSPHVSTPSMSGFILMMIGGIGWGVYTLRGRGSSNPLADTSFNFARTIPFVITLFAVTYHPSDISTKGLILAIISGGISSGIGYTIWYRALRNLTDTQSAVVQLAVPVIAAIGGVIFVSESISLRLIISTIFILGGILTVILGKYYYVILKQTSNT